MRLARYAFAVAVMTFGLATPATAQEATEAAASPSAAQLALAREVVDLGFPADGREAVFYKSMDQMSAQMREAVMRSMPPLDPGALAILDGWLQQNTAQSKRILREHIPALMDSTALAYANMLSESELQGLRDFLASPSGHGFLARNADILADPNFAKANQDYMTAIMANVQAQQGKLMAALTAYYKDKGKDKRK